MRTRYASKSWAPTLAWLALAASVAGCSGGNGVPLGGPFGGSVTSAVLDASALDGSGVLDPSTASSTGGLSSGAQTPTWTQLYDAYFKDGTPGNCAHAGCHQSDMTSPSATFTWLMSQNQLGGTQPALLDPSSSCFTWLGGDMPPGGPGADPSIQNDFDLWLKAGAKDN